jgi:hypothetical protein
VALIEILKYALSVFFFHFPAAAHFLFFLTFFLPFFAATQGVLSSPFAGEQPRPNAAHTHAS